MGFSNLDCNIDKNLADRYSFVQICQSNCKIRVRKRVWIWDFIRGICIFLMILDHLLYDFSVFYSKLLVVAFPADGVLSSIVSFARSYWKSDYRRIIRSIVIFLFFFVSGVSSNFSKSNFMRGSKLLIISFIVSIMTILFNGKVDGQIIRFSINRIIIFGVLHCISVSMLFYSYLQKIRLNKAWVMFAISMVIFCLYVYLKKNPISDDSFLSAILGLNQTKLAKTPDYFPIIPFLGAFLLGCVFAQIFNVQRYNKPPKFVSPICFLGRNTLIIYLSHQIVFIGIYYVVRFFALM